MHRRITARVQRTEDGLVHKYEVDGAVFNSLEDIPSRFSTREGEVQ